MDAVYKDVALALLLERSLDLFGQGVKCHGAGPSATKRSKRDFQAQSERASEYADVLLQQASDEDTVTGTKGESEETSSGSEIETTKKRKNKEQDRCER